MLLNTAEIRWFWPAVATEAAWSWFSDRPPTGLPSETRTDRYLVLLEDGLSSWLTLWFEAGFYAEDAAVILRTTAGHFFRQRQGLPAGLAEARSCSYPEWLLDLTR